MFNTLPFGSGLSEAVAILLAVAFTPAIIIVTVAVTGLLLASVMGSLIDSHDDATGRRPGGYGSDISFTWRNVLAGVGFLMVLLSPFAAFIAR